MQRKLFQPKKRERKKRKKSTKFASIDTQQNLIYHGFCMHANSTVFFRTFHFVCRESKWMFHIISFLRPTIIELKRSERARESEKTNTQTQATEWMRKRNQQILTQRINFQRGFNGVWIVVGVCLIVFVLVAQLIRIEVRIQTYTYTCEWHTC